MVEWRITSLENKNNTIILLPITSGNIMAWPWHAPVRVKEVRLRMRGRG
jgi:hypothetical protein